MNVKEIDVKHEFPPIVKGEISLDEVRFHVHNFMDNSMVEDKADIRIKDVRRHVEKKMKLARGALKTHKQTIVNVCTSYVMVRLHSFTRNMKMP